MKAIHGHPITLGIADPFDKVLFCSSTVPRASHPPNIVDGCHLEVTFLLVRLPAVFGQQSRIEIVLLIDIWSWLVFRSVRIRGARLEPADVNPGMKLVRRPFRLEAISEALAFFHDAERPMPNMGQLAREAWSNLVDEKPHCFAHIVLSPLTLGDPFTLLFSSTNTGLSCLLLKIARPRHGILMLALDT